MNFRFRDKKIGISKLKHTYFMHVHDIDTEITKSYVLQFSTKHLLDPWVTYDFKYRMHNMLFVRFGYRIFQQ